MPFLRGGGEYGRRTDVESRERRDAGIVNDVVVPVLLALAITVGVGLLWVSFLLMLRAIADHVYWLVVVVGSGVMWLAPLLTRWRYRDEVTVVTVFAGGLLTVAFGWLATALWRLTRDLSWRELLTTVPVVSLPVGVAWLFIATFWESFFRSPFLEKAIGNIIGGEEGPWWKVWAEAAEAEVAEPETVTIRWSDVDENGNVTHWQRLDFPVDQDKAKWLAGHILGGGNLSIPQCSGSGKPLSKGDVQDIQDWMILRGFGNWKDPQEHSRGFEVGKKGEALMKGLRAQL